MAIGLKKLFGANLKSFRKERGLTQASLAQSIDKSIDLISQIERGTSSPSFETIEDLSGALNINAQDLFNGSGLLEGTNANKYAKLQGQLAKLSGEDLQWVNRILQAVLSK